MDLPQGKDDNIRLLVCLGIVMICVIWMLIQG